MRFCAYCGCTSTIKYREFYDRDVDGISYENKMVEINDLLKYLIDLLKQVIMPIKLGSMKKRSCIMGSPDSNPITKSNKKDINIYIFFSIFDLQMRES